MFEFRRSKAAAKGPRGKRAYVIGDVHGCLDELDRLLARIEEDSEGRARSRTSIVFLGDLIDRGPHSARVVERLRTYSPPNASTHFIMGNHEEVMLKVLSGESDLLASWLRFGGGETLISYGVDPAEVRRLAPDEAAERIARAVPQAHVDFLESFADSVVFGGYVFVHAGIRPGIELGGQSPSDLRWIREPFLSDPGDHGFVVVHGHTITNEVEFAPNRIGIDTGAFCTGTLTALAIEERERWLLQTCDRRTRRVPVGSQLV